MARSLLVFNTLVGGAGLGFAIAYVMLVVVAFVPGGEAVAGFMVGHPDGTPGFGYTLIVVPYVLLLLHLWLRVNVARILVEMGELGRTEAFALKRLKVGLLRSKREGLANRTALMRIAARGRDYDRLEEVAVAAELPRRGLFSAMAVDAAFHRWRLEGALRRENLVACRAIVDGAWPMAGRGPEVAEFCACAAELAVRNNEPDEVRAWRERSEFASPGVERMRIVDAFAAARFDEELDAALVEQLDPSTLSWTSDLPGAGLELATIRVALGDGSIELREASEEWRDVADARSLHVWEKAKSDHAEPASETV